MKTNALTLSLLAAAMLMPLAFSTACSREVSREESDKPGWFGGRTKKETVVYENPDGSHSTSYEKKTTNP